MPLPPPPLAAEPFTARKLRIPEGFVPVLDPLREALLLPSASVLAMTASLHQSASICSFIAAGKRFSGVVLENTGRENTRLGEPGGLDGGEDMEAE